MTPSCSIAQLDIGLASPRVRMLNSFMLQSKPVSPSSERNKDPILQVLKMILSDSNQKLLEIGSGTGQHAAYFASHFPHLEWVTSDLASQHEGIRMWIEEANLPNLRGPLEIEIGRHQIPQNEFDVVFSANVLHIISWKQAQLLFQMLGESLKPQSQVIFYGPFNYNGQYTSPSNAEFDQWLKARNPESGIRSFEDICKAMKVQNFILKKDYEMPSNNRILHFQR